MKAASLLLNAIDAVPSNATL